MEGRGEEAKQELPLSSILSPLVPRGERKKDVLQRLSSFGDAPQSNGRKGGVGGTEPGNHDISRLNRLIVEAE